MKPQPFCHLHGHSQFSLADTVGQKGDLVKCAADLGFESMCVTDHGNTAGWFDHVDDCKKYGIKPLLGCELYVARDSRLVRGMTNDEEKAFKQTHGRKMTKDEKKAFVKHRTQSGHMVAQCMDNVGIHNLYALTSDANANGFYRSPRTDWDMLSKHSDGLIVTSACLGGVLAKPLLAGDTEWLNRSLSNMIDIFGDRFYIEFQLNESPDQQRANLELLKISRHYNIKTVICQDFHYPYKGDQEVHDYVKMLGFKTLKKDFTRLIEHPMHVCTYEEAWAYWCRNHPQMGQAVFTESMANTKAIEQMCNPMPDYTSRKYPAFPLPQGFTDKVQYLNHLVAEGWQKRVPHMCQAPGNKTYDDYSKRLQYEMSVISQMDYIDYFLVCADFVQWAKRSGVATGPARGSAGGCLLSWILGITEVDPLRFNLIFERFLNPERDKAPDIDSDFSDIGRHQVRQYLKDRWGEDKVATISARYTYAPKGTFKDICRCHDIPFAEVNALASHVDKDAPFSRSVQASPDLQKFLSKHNLNNIAYVIDRLRGQVKHLTQAAAGMIVAGQPIRDITSLTSINDPESDERMLITELDSDTIQDSGFLKMDVLGIKELKTLHNASKMIPEMKEYDEKAGQALQWLYDKCPLNDSQTWELFKNGDCLCVFQFGGNSITKLVGHVKPQDIDELAICSALHRPQPMQSGFTEQYWKRKQGIEQITGMHPFIDDIFKPTYSVLVYQEQFIEVFNRLGLTYGEADILRREYENVVKETKRKKAQEKIDKLLLKMKQNRPPELPEKDVEMIANAIGGEVGYSFNKSHSVAYSLLAYYCQYMKAHYPVQYFLAALNSELHEDIEKKPLSAMVGRIATAFEEMYGKKLTFLIGNINMFSPKFSLMYDQDQNPFLFMGIERAKGFGEKACEELVQRRKDHGPFETIKDFFAFNDWKLGKINKTVIKVMIDIGMFEHIPLSKENPITMNRLEMAVWYNSYSDEKNKKSSRTVFFDASMVFPPKPMILQDAILIERQYFGMQVTSNIAVSCASENKKLSRVEGPKGERAVMATILDSERREKSTALTVSCGGEHRKVIAYDSDFANGVLRLHTDQEYMFILQSSEKRSIDRVVKITEMPRA